MQSGDAIGLLQNLIDPQSDKGGVTRRQAEKNLQLPERDTTGIKKTVEMCCNLWV